MANYLSFSLWRYYTTSDPKFRDDGVKITSQLSNIYVFTWTGGSFRGDYGIWRNNYGIMDGHGVMLNYLIKNTTASV